MSQRYFLKKYIPVYQADQSLCVGYAHLDDRPFLKYPYHPDTLQALETALLRGVEAADLTQPVLCDLHAADFLEVGEYIHPDDLRRSDLFLQYAGIDLLSEEQKNTPILIFGAGAGGSTLAYQLAQLEFRNLILIDNDTVSEPDTQRMFTYHREDIGQYKVEALAARIERNFDYTVRTQVAAFEAAEDIARIVDRYEPELVVKACDPDPLFATHLNQICFERGLPHLHMAYAFEEVIIGPLYIPGFTSCHQSTIARQVATYGPDHHPDKSKRLFRGLLAQPSIVYQVNLLGAFITKEILMFLTGHYEHCCAIGRTLYFSPFSMGLRAREASCPDDCPVCAEARQQAMNEMEEAQ